MQTSPKSHVMVEETPDAKATFAPEWDESLTRERILPRLRLLWAMRRFLGRCALVGLFVTTLIAFLVPSEYESTARLMPPDQQPGGGLALMAMLGGGQNGGSGGLGSLATDLLGVKTTGAMFIAVMHSRTAEDGIIQRFDLKKVYWTRLEESTRKRLEKNTEILEDRKSGVITLIVTDHDAKRAAAMAGAYIEQLDALTAKLNTSAAHRERVFLEDRLNKIMVELESAEKDFSQFASKNATIDISAQGRAMLEGAASLQGQLIGAESQLEGLRQIYSDNNIRVRSTQARIAELRSQLQKLGGTSGVTVPSDQSTTDNAYPTLRQLPILGVPYADKFRQLKVDEAVYETLTKQFELAKVQEAKEIPSVKVLDQPDVPERKSFPPRTLIIILGTACSVLLGAAWVFGTARWRQIDPHDPGMRFAQKVFGTVRAGMPWVSANGSNGNAAANGHSGKNGEKPVERSKTASA
ncbi:MAG TPA: GNVR domain-containing protein [Candidatus Acidoferrum sp.]|nr:GNVR domain-containing protein [Candidatus Acidoferrum sp.]